MNANDSRPARIRPAMASIGSPARSQARARRTLGTSVARNGAGPSRSTRTPRPTRRPISSSVTSASPASSAGPRACAFMAAILTAAPGGAFY
jgi:hypothetical protein